MSADWPEDSVSGAGLGSTQPRPETVRSLPDVEALRSWLVGRDLIQPDGGVLSWSNANHPGYPYPEAAGLFLSALCTAPRFEGEVESAANRVAAWLSRSIRRDGGVGRDGATYLFDSAVALAGLLRYRSVEGRAVADDSIHQLHNFVCEQIAAATAVLPKTAAADGRWSTQFGAHLVKCLHSLQLYGRTFGETLHEDLVAALINRSGHQPSPIYLHPFCYEQEGHVVVLHYDLGHLFEPIDGALEWLAALQQPEGAILAFANGMDGFGEPRTDATAQAVRLWILHDRDRYRQSIARGLAFLAGCQAPQGGIRYSPARNDVCSWSTMFTMQAVDWFLDGPRVEQLL